MRAFLAVLSFLVSMPAFAVNGLICSSTYTPYGNRASFFVDPQTGVFSYLETNHPRRISMRSINGTLDRCSITNEVGTSTGGGSLYEAEVTFRCVADSVFLNGRETNPSRHDPAFTLVITTVRRLERLPASHVPPEVHGSRSGGARLGGGSGILVNTYNEILSTWVNAAPYWDAVHFEGCRAEGSARQQYWRFFGPEPGHRIR